MFRLSTALSVLAFAGLVWMLFEQDKMREAAVFGGKVTWVSDGDTFQIEGHDWPVRLWGVDAPERDTVEGVAAREFVTDLILGQRLDCQKVVVDRFRRTVARCRVNDEDLSPLILEAGHGVEMCSFTGGELGYC